MNGLYLHPFFLLKDNQNKNVKERFFLLVYALLLVYMLLKSKILKSSMRLLAAHSRPSSNRYSKQPSPSAKPINHSRKLIVIEISSMLFKSLQDLNKPSLLKPNLLKPSVLKAYCSFQIEDLNQPYTCVQVDDI